jgi:hypothetical protein
LLSQASIRFAEAALATQPQSSAGSAMLINNRGFIGFLGQTFSSFDVSINGVGTVSSSPFGCNDDGEIVGSLTNKAGNVHGFIFAAGRLFRFDVPACH